MAPFFEEVGAFVSGLIDEATATAALARRRDDSTATSAQPAVVEAGNAAQCDALESRVVAPECLVEACAGNQSSAPSVAIAEIAPPDAEKPKPKSASGWTRWTLRRLAKVVAEKFGRPVSRETIRRLLHKAGHSWKKAKKILGRADPTKRAAFVEEIRKLLDRVLHDEAVVLAYIDEAHVHQDADMGFGWSTCGERLYVASSSPGLKAKVTFFGIYLYSEPTVRIWPYERANGVLTIDVLERLRREHGDRPIVVVWDGASYHRSGIVHAAAERLHIELVRLPPYSPDFMPVEALWHWLREEVTYNFCHDTPRELIERVERFVSTICSDACALADRLWVKDELDPDEEKVRFSR